MATYHFFCCFELSSKFLSKKNKYGPILSVEQKTNRRKREFSKQLWLYYKDLYEINKVLLLLNEHGDPSFLFQNSSSYNINNQLAKFEKNLSVGSISVEWP